MGFYYGNFLEKSLGGTRVTEKSENCRGITNRETLPKISNFLYTFSTTPTMPPSSPIPHDRPTEYNIPTRKGIRTNRFNYSMTLESIAKTRNIPLGSVWNVCNATTSRRATHNPKKEEKRSSKPKISTKDIW